MKRQLSQTNPKKTCQNTHQKGTVEGVMSLPEWYSEVQMMVTGTLSQPLPKKDKQQVPRSPRKKPITTLVLSCIPDGVQVKPGLVGSYREA
jgi:hypothetical protein